VIDRRFGKALPQFSRLPVPVREIGNAVAVAAGGEFSAALLADGTIRTWGSGEYGIPGDGVLEARMGYDHLAPARVLGIDSAVKISAGGNFVFALLQDGTIRAWGNNNLPLGAKGVLGTAANQTTAVPTPVQGISNAVDVVASGGGGVALLADGTLRAWGDGYGTGHRPQDQATNKPVAVEGIRGPIAISPNMVLMPDGSVRDFPFQPSWTTPKLTNAVAIASGGVNRFALLADGRLIAWGHRRFYPNGVVTLATLGPETARQCAARPR
jgi:alpha-tubulin suppressor-like RCC1 family protein